MQNQTEKVVFGQSGGINLLFVLLDGKIKVHWGRVSSDPVI